MSQKIPRVVIGSALVLIALGVVIGVLWVIVRRPGTTVYEAALVGAGLASISLLMFAVTKIREVVEKIGETKL